MFKAASLFVGGLLLATSAMSDVDISSFSTPHVAGEMLITFEEDMSLEEQQSIIDQNNAVVLKRYKSSNTVLVKIPEESTRMLDSASFSQEALG